MSLTATPQAFAKCPSDGRASLRPTPESRWRARPPPNRKDKVVFEKYVRAIKCREFCHHFAEAIQVLCVSRAVAGKAFDQLVKFSMKLLGCAVLRLKLGHRRERILPGRSTSLAQTRKERDFLILSVLDTRNSKVRARGVYRREHTRQ